MTTPLCSHCWKRTATCIGCYDEREEFEHACDVCCLHGCEDGRCWPIEQWKEDYALFQTLGLAGMTDEVQKQRTLAGLKARCLISWS